MKNIDNAEVRSVETIKERQQVRKQTNGFRSYGDVDCVAELSTEHQLIKLTSNVFERSKNYYVKKQVCSQASINYLYYSAYK